MIEEPQDKAPEEVETAPEAADAAPEEETPEVSDETDTEEDQDEEEEEEEQDPKDKKIAELEYELANMRNMLLRTRADMENFRKRNERERAETTKFANRKIFNEMLEVLDNFDRAMTAAPDAKDNFVIGVTMIQKQLIDVLKQNGVEEINAEGRLFDPYLDEAIAREHTSEYEEHTIIEVFQKGFRFHGQLLRPSKVKVAAKPEAVEAEEAVTEEE
ncbi:MAG: nucleotide exchange factor GrpE [Acidobacteriota bacterium]|nr:nucleotide exchange factor GrpE [Acidobacteriota bacterium]